VLEPGAIEAAAAAERAKKHAAATMCSEALNRDLEAARYAADKAFRQYDATDPAHRLVATELELRWSRALERVTELEGRIEKHLGETPTMAPTSPEQFLLLGSVSGVAPKSLISAIALSNSELASAAVGAPVFTIFAAALWTVDVKQHARLLSKIRARKA
jgi:hypothetical protein